MVRRIRQVTKAEKVADLVRILDERVAKLQKEPAWENEYDSLILGDGPRGTYSMDPSVSTVNNNVLVISGTGGGKTKSVVEANLLHAHHQSMVVLLTKRRLLDQYAPLLKNRGYDVKVLDLVHPELATVGYDPMLHLKDDTDIIGLAKALVSSSGCASEKEPYWETSAADLFTAFVKLSKILYGNDARMEDVISSIHRILLAQKIGDKYYVPDVDDISMSELRSLPPTNQFMVLQDKEPEMFMHWNQYYYNGDTTKACIRSLLLSAMNSVLTKGIQQVMKKREQLEFIDLVNRKSVLFILTSPVNPALHPFANLLLGSLFKELFEYAESLPSGRVPIPLTAICDDFATGGQIPNFQQHISIFREKGIAAIMLVQSLSQLNSMYGEQAAITIQDNTDNIIYMGGNNIVTAAQMAQRINKPMDEVLALPRGQIYLFRSGQKALQLQRYRIFDDPVYQQEIAPLDAARRR